MFATLFITIICISCIMNSINPIVLCICPSFIKVFGIDLNGKCPTLCTVFNKISYSCKGFYLFLWGKGTKANWIINYFVLIGLILVDADRLKVIYNCFNLISKHADGIYARVFYICKFMILVLIAVKVQNWIMCALLCNVMVTLCLFRFEIGSLLPWG